MAEGILAAVNENGNIDRFIDTKGGVHYIEPKRYEESVAKIDAAATKAKETVNSVTEAVSECKAQTGACTQETARAKEIADTVESRITGIEGDVAALRDSVTPTGFTCLQGSIESGTYCAYICIGHLVCVVMNNMPSLGTKGVLPKEYRPPTDIIGFGYVRGTNTSGQILINSAGEVETWCNQNNPGYFSGSVCYVVE